MIPLNTALNNGIAAPPGVIPSLDFETRSTCDLKTAGARRYAQDPTTDVLCLAIKAGPAERIWAPGHPMPDIMFAAILRGDTLAAWNASFEIAIWQEIMVPRYGWPALPVERFTCTMQRAALVGCPGALERAAVALKLASTKDMEGHRLMMKMCKPLPTRKGDAPDLVRWHDDPADHLRLQAYCMGDTRTESAAAAMLPVPPPMEVAVMRVDRLINTRGVTIDRLAAEGAAKIARVEKARLNGEMKQITNGQIGSTNQVALILDFIGHRGVHMDKLRAADVRDMLANDEDADPSGGDLDVTAEQLAAYDALNGSMDPIAKRVLQLRAEAAKASTAKLDALVKGTLDDGRMVDLFAYGGAYRTQRWCLPAYTPVTVLRGRHIFDTAITDVRPDDLVWDGETWVPHEGVVFSGMKRVMAHDGVVATADHKVYVNETDSLPLGEAAAQGLGLWHGRDPVLDIRADIPERKKVHRTDETRCVEALARPCPIRQADTHVTPAARLDTEARGCCVHRGDSAGGSRVGCGESGRDAIHSGNAADLEHNLRRGRGQPGGYAEILASGEIQPRTRGGVSAETLGGVRTTGQGPAPSQSEFGGEVPSVEGFQRPNGISERHKGVPNRAQGETPARLSILQVDRTAMDSGGASAPRSAETQQCESRARAMGRSGSDATEGQYVSGCAEEMGNPLGGDSRAKVGADCTGPSGTDPFRRGEGEAQGGHTPLLGGETAGEEPTFDIVNAGPRNRFRAWGRIVSNSGRRFQAQNLPRGNPPFEEFDQIEAWYDALASGHYETFVAMLPSGMTVMDGLKASLRGFITASAPKRRIAIADLGQIEARGAAWAAGQWDVIEAFEKLDAAVRRGAPESEIKTLDIYTVTGAKMGADRQGGKVGVLGCGYGAGVGAIIAFAAGYGLMWDAGTAQNIVDSWRSANPMIVRAWADEERCAKAAINSPGSVVLVNDGRTGSYCCQGGNLLRKLPSGRCLVYRNIRIEPMPTPWGQTRMTITYDGNIFAKNQPGTFVRVKTYAGKLFQNAIQAICRDILAAGLIRADRAGLACVLHVHDEQGVDCHMDEAEEHAQMLVRAMTDPIAWVEGLPITSSADITYRYRKS